MLFPSKSHVFLSHHWCCCTGRLLINKNHKGGCLSNRQQKCMLFLSNSRVLLSHHWCCCTGSLLINKNHKGGCLSIRQQTSILWFFFKVQNSKCFLWWKEMTSAYILKLNIFILFLPNLFGEGMLLRAPIFFEQPEFFCIWWCLVIYPCLY